MRGSSVLPMNLLDSFSNNTSPELVKAAAEEMALCQFVPSEMNSVQYI